VATLPDQGLVRRSEAVAVFLALRNVSGPRNRTGAKCAHCL